MVGISLLTLVPQLSGGSETYARELVRALARVGQLEYRVFAPSIAPDAVDGLPGTTSRRTVPRVQERDACVRWRWRASIPARCSASSVRPGSTRSTSR